jgi:seryl-tRNA synthetase
MHRRTEGLAQDEKACQTSEKKASSKKSVIIYIATLFIVVLVFIVLSYLNSNRSSFQISTLHQKNATALQNIEDLQSENLLLKGEKAAFEEKLAELEQKAWELESQLRETRVSWRDDVQDILTSDSEKYNELLDKYNELLKNDDSKGMAMIDIRVIRDSPEEVKTRLKDKLIDCSESVDRILALDVERRELIAASETCKAEQNKISKQIPQLKKEGADTTALITGMNALKESIRVSEAKLKDVEAEYSALLLSLPNLPDKDLVPGGKENNEPVRYFGQELMFDFEPKNHVDLCTELGLIDYVRGAKLSGSGFWVYRGVGARLEWALLNYFIDTHLADGYELILVPHIWDMNRPDGRTVPEIRRGRLLAGESSETNAVVSCCRRRNGACFPAPDEILPERSCRVNIYLTHRASGAKPARTERRARHGARASVSTRSRWSNIQSRSCPDEAFDELVAKAEALVKGLGSISGP